MDSPSSQQAPIDRENAPTGLLAVATVVLALVQSYCLVAGKGIYDTWPVAITCLAWVGWMVVFLIPRAWHPRLDVGRALPVVCGLGLMTHLAVTLLNPPGELGVINPAPALLEWQVLLPPVAAALLFAFVRKGRPGTPAVLALVALAFAFAAVAVIRSTVPVIDVFTWQQVAAERLTHGVNPYVPPMPDVYRGVFNELYPPGLVGEHMEILTGIVYPPATVLMTLPGYVMGSDIRWANLVWLCVGVGAVAVLHRTRLALAATALLLFSPIIYRVIVYAWTEPVLVFGLALVVCSRLKYPRLLPFALGLMISTKQYGVIFLPLASLLLPRPLRVAAVCRFYAIALAVAAAIALPFLLWNPSAFVHSTMLYHLKSPFRGDSFGLLPMLGPAGQSALAGMLAPLSLLVLTPLLLLRMPRDAFGFSVSVGVLSMAFFLLSKQSFMNYQFFSMSALLIGVAVCPDDRLSPEAARS